MSMFKTFQIIETIPLNIIEVIQVRNMSFFSFSNCIHCDLRIRKKTDDKNIFSVNPDLSEYVKYEAYFFFILND